MYFVLSLHDRNIHNIMQFMGIWKMITTSQNGNIEYGM